MRLRVEFDPEQSFWVMNKQFKYVEPFKSLYNEDKSKTKKESSTMMWAIYFIYDIDSMYFDLEMDKRVELTCVDYIGDPKFYDKNLDSVSILGEAYVECCYTTAEKSLADFNHKMRERSKIIAETAYTFDYYEEDPKTGRLFTKKGTADQLDKMMERTKKLYDLYQSILKDLSGEEGDEGVMGGEMESLVD